MSPRRRTRWPMAPLLVLALALAGCGAKDSGAGQVRLGDGSRLSLDLPPEQQPAPDDIRGAVSGVVVDDAIFPVPGAQVSVRDRDIAATADGDGLFVFEQMPPGLYTLEVRMAGHSDGLGTVNVKSGQVAKSVLQVPRLPFVAPYHTTWAFDELRELDEGIVWGTAGHNEHVVAFDRPVAGLVLESSWPGLQAGLGDPLDYSIAGEAHPDKTMGGGAPNPMVQTVEKDFFDADEYAARLRVYPSYTTMPGEVRGRVFATAFYVDPPPADWSFIGGSA